MAIGLHLYRRGDEKEWKPAEETEADGEGGKYQTRFFQEQIFENLRTREAGKSEHFGDAADSTTDARSGEGVCPPVCRVSVCPLQGIADKTACHNNDRHPQRNVSDHCEVDPKGVFNNSVGEGVKDFTELRGLVTFPGNDAVNRIEREDQQNREDECNI